MSKFDSLFGPGRLKRGSTSLPQRGVVRVDGADDSVIYDDPDTGETVLDLSALIAGATGQASVVNYTGSLAVGDVVTSALLIGDPSAVTKATTSPLFSGGSVRGIVVLSPSGGRVTIALPGATLPPSVTGLAAPTQRTDVMVTSSARAQLVSAPVFIADTVGWADTAGILHLVPGRFAAVTVNVRSAPYYAKGDASTDDWAALQQAIEDVAALGGGIVDCPGTFQYDIRKPLEVRESNVHLRGAGRFASIINLRNDSVIGPAIYQAPDNTSLLTYVPASIGGNAWRLGLEDFSTAANVIQLWLDNIPSVHQLHGQSALTIELGFKYRGGDTTHRTIFNGNGATVEGVNSQTFAMYTADDKFQCDVRTSTGFQHLEWAIPNGNRHVWGLHFDGAGGRVAIRLDGVEVTAITCGTTLVQKPWTQSVIGPVTEWPDAGATTLSAPVDLDVVRMGIVVNPTTPITTSNRGAYDIGETFFYLDFPDPTGNFLVGHARATLPSGYDLDTWIPLRRTVGGTGASGAEDCKYEHLMINGSYGAALIIAEGPNNHVESCELRGLHGLLLSNNGFFSHIERTTATCNFGSDQTIGSMGFLVGGLCSNVVSYGIGASGFNFGYVGNAFASLRGGHFDGVVAGVTVVGNTHYIASVHIDDEQGFPVTWGLGLFNAGNVDQGGVEVHDFQHDGISGPTSHVTLSQAVVDFYGSRFYHNNSTTEVFHYQSGANRVTLHECIKKNSVSIGIAAWATDNGIELLSFPEEVTGVGTVDFASDANVTLTPEQQMHFRIDITDSGTVLTTTRNVVFALHPGRRHMLSNSTAQDLRIKTPSGTGIIIPTLGSVLVHCGSTDWHFYAPSEIQRGAGAKLEMAAPADADGELQITGVNRSSWTNIGGTTKVYDEIYEATTTATTADQTIATITIGSGGTDISVDVWATKGAGSAGAQGGRATVLQSYVYDGTNLVELGTANGDVQYAKGQTITAKLVPSGLTALAKVTPWSASSTKWYVGVQRKQGS